jgi:tRNA-specific 2-thiouridylase
MLQIRHQQTPVECTISFDKIFVVKFQDKVRGVAPGQSAVFYENDVCLGGGIITETF